MEAPTRARGPQVIEDAAALSRLSYVLISPARNEEQYIRLTLESVIAQTHRPVRWVIVSDASSDRTDDIVREYLEEHSWIRLIRMPERRDRDFSAKVRCFRTGLAVVEDVAFDVLGNLDADISFDGSYFDFLMKKFEENPKLGVAGTPFIENGSHYDYRFTNIEHVSGACQLFRRECFDEIGGYPEITGGGIDWTAVTTARMMGWRTRTFTEKHCLHHRPMGTGSANKLKGIFRLGQKDYYLGGHPLWQVFRSAYQMTRPPYILGGASLLAGYSWAWWSRVERPVTSELMQFNRSEQMARLRAFFMPRRSGHD